MSSIVVVNTRPEHFAALAAHQRLCFPTLHQSQLLAEEHFASHLQIFPEGQHVALDGERVIGQSSTFRCRSEQALQQHLFHEILAEGFFTNHDPQGEWLYGADMSVHPDYRRRGVARMLYDARKVLIRRLGMRGMVAGGMLPGYKDYRAQMSVAEYIDAVVAGQLTDPTLTAQLRNGFTVRGVFYDYIDAGELGNDAAMIVWEAAQEEA